MWGARGAPPCTRGVGLEWSTIQQCSEPRESSVVRGGASKAEKSGAEKREGEPCKTRLQVGVPAETSKMNQIARWTGARRRRVGVRDEVDLTFAGVCLGSEVIHHTSLRRRKRAP